MTLTLEIAKETEASLRSIAARRGETLESLALTQLEQLAIQAKADERQARLARLRGSVKGSGPTVAQFLDERCAEARREAAL